MPRNISGTVISAALDENSGQASAVVVPSVQTPLGDCEPGGAGVHDDEQCAVSLTGTADDLEATLQNVGVAGIEPGDSVWVRLDTTGTGFTFRSGDVALKRLSLSTGSSGVTWLLTAPLVTGVYDLAGLVDDGVAYDENKYSDSLVVRQVGSDTTR